MDVFDLDMAELTLTLEAKQYIRLHHRNQNKKIYVARHKTYADFNTITVLIKDSEEEARQYLDNADHVRGEYSLKEVAI